MRGRVWLSGWFRLEFSFHDRIMVSINVRIMVRVMIKDKNSVKV